MPGRLVRKPLKLGDYPLITARFPVEHARALRLHAVANGQPLQQVLRDLVADWFTVHTTVHNRAANDTARNASDAAPMMAIPKTQETRENTGRNEPFRTLKKIDRERKGAAKNSVARD